VRGEGKLGYDIEAVGKVGVGGGRSNGQRVQRPDILCSWAGEVIFISESSVKGVGCWPRHLVAVGCWEGDAWVASA